MSSRGTHDHRYCNHRADLALAFGMACSVHHRCTVEATLQALFALLTTLPVSSTPDEATPAPALDGDWRRDQARASSSQLWLDRSISADQHFVATTVGGMSSGIRVGARRDARRRGLELRARVTLTRIVFELRF